MKKYILFSFFIAVLSFPKDTFATHNISGDITYNWTSGYTYEITVHTFTNISSPADRCELTIYFGDGDSALAPRVNGGSSGNCPGGHDGVAIGNNLRFNVYQTVHIYPGSGQYYISMMDPNRSANLLNMTNSVNSPFILHAYLKIDPLLGNGNSTPVWNHFLDLDTLYTNVWHSFNLSGNDIDGDSVVYTHIPCIGSTGYVTPFYSNYFGINPNTGMLSWDVATQIGYFAYDVLVQEYRHIGNSYILIGYTTREIFNVVYASSGINNLDQNLIQTSIFPNPSNTDLTITLNSTNKFSNLILEVLDISGREVQVKYEVKDQTITVKQGLSSGFYIYKVFDKGAYLGDGKFEITE